MAYTELPRMLLAICISLLQTLPASAQTTSPTNNTASTSGNVQFIIDTTLNNMGTHININPLTNEAGLAGSLAQLQRINPQGPLMWTNPQTVQSLSPGEIAYISCEPSDYTGSIDSTRTINLAVNIKPYAIVLYSIYAAQCIFTASNDFSYTSLYTMVDANSSVAVVDGLQKSNPPLPQTSIHVNQATVNGSSSNNGNILGKSPTTAVAMIILYSITGIITALFLIIIIVGAVRAHRHPERYGPRHIIGRPRQSRAKGIARAMLETIPIVKFGAKEDDKPPEQGRDVELGTNTEHRANAESVSEQPEENGEASENQRGDGPDVVRTEEAAGTSQTSEGAAAGSATDNGLACSVCTDDFIKGQDIRVLPCKHKFHPECIDPWLLNVSGTCPMCRVDLHPADSDGTPIVDAEDHPSLETHRESYFQPPTANTETTRRNRRSRILSTLNIGRMRHATPEERIEALRTLRSEHLASEVQAQGGQSAINRFSRRLSRALGSRPNSGAPTTSRPVSEVPPPVAGGVHEGTGVQEEGHEEQQSSAPEIRSGE